IEHREKGRIGRICCRDRQAVFEDRSHLPFGLAARTRTRHSHGDTYRVGGKHEIAGLARQLAEQDLAGGAVGPCQALDVLPEAIARLDRGKQKGNPHSPTANSSRLHNFLRSHWLVWPSSIRIPTWPIPAASCRAHASARR